MTLVHSWSVRVYYEDTDFSAAVYHGSYVRFLERGRTEFLRTCGLTHRVLFEGAEGRPFGFVIRRMAVEFLKPAHMDDLLTVETRLTEMRGASARMAQRVLRDDNALVTADVRFAVVAEGRAIRFPPSVRAALERAR